MSSFIDCKYNILHLIMNLKSAGGIFVSLPWALSLSVIYGQSNARHT